MSDKDDNDPSSEYYQCLIVFKLPAAVSSGKNGVPTFLFIKLLDWRNQMEIIFYLPS